jgi:hypothetical protein
MSDNVYYVKSWRILDEDSLNRDWNHEFVLFVSFMLPNPLRQSTTIGIFMAIVTF